MSDCPPGCRVNFNIFEFASVMKVLGRVTGALFIHIYLKSNEKKKTSTKVKSQFALKVDFIESKTLDIA